MPTAERRWAARIERSGSSRRWRRGRTERRGTRSETTRGRVIRGPEASQREGWILRVSSGRSECAWLVAVQQPWQNGVRLFLSLRAIELVANACILVADLRHPVVCVLVLSVLDRSHPVVKVLELIEPSEFYLFALVRQRLDRCQHNRRSARAQRARTKSMLVRRANFRSGYERSRAIPPSDLPARGHLCKFADLCVFYWSLLHTHAKVQRDLAQRHVRH